MSRVVYFIFFLGNRESKRRRKEGLRYIERLFTVKDLLGGWTHISCRHIRSVQSSSIVWLGTYFLAAFLKYSIVIMSDNLKRKLLMYYSLFFKIKDKACSEHKLPLPEAFFDTNQGLIHLKWRFNLLCAICFTLNLLFVCFVHKLIFIYFVPCTWPCICVYFNCARYWTLSLESLMETQTVGSPL